MDDQNESLKQFFGVYFHQDWRLEALDWPEEFEPSKLGPEGWRKMIPIYLSDQVRPDADAVRHLATKIRDFAEAHTDDLALDLHSEFGANLGYRGPAAASLLRDIALALAEEADRIEKDT